MGIEELGARVREGNEETYSEEKHKHLLKKPNRFEDRIKDLERRIDKLEIKQNSSSWEHEAKGRALSLAYMEAANLDNKKDIENQTREQEKASRHLAVDFAYTAAINRAEMTAKSFRVEKPIPKGMQKFIEGIDWYQLAEQRLTLKELINSRTITEHQEANLISLANLLDALAKENRGEG